MTQVLPGLIAAPGIGIGALRLYRPGFAAPVADEQPVRDAPAEWFNFLAAHARVDHELELLSTGANSLMAEIFASHRVILQDKSLLDAIQAAIFTEKISAAAATYRVVSQLTESFRAFEDDYFAGRAIDILDLGQRLLGELGTALSRPQLEQLPPQTVLVAEDLTVSDLSRLPPGHIVGIALAYSTPTAHSAILARSLEIPLVCTLGPAALQMLPGQTAVVDGNQGSLIVDLTEADLHRFMNVRNAYLAAGAAALTQAHLPAYTLDGVHIPVLGNANSPEEVAQSRKAGADGIGLLRTEYLFRGRAVPPGFDEQQATYLQFMAQVEHQLTVRALDAGGDKPVDYIAHRREDNPFLGLRGVRLLIAEPELLRTQYRALQAAAQLAQSSHSGGPVDVRFMLPMISTAEEIFAVRTLLEPLSDESNDTLLLLGGLAGSSLPPLKLGIMIEVPSAALIAGSLAPHVDFFSIGTNDLAQYVLASDRTNSSVAKLADPLHPAVLRLVHNTCLAAHAAGKPVSLCGEVAGDPLAAPLLIGLGVTELSTPLPAVAIVKETIRHVSLAHCRNLAAAALACGSAAAVRALLAADQQHAPHA
jgi:phosphocarrier protein FPr